MFKIPNVHKFLEGRFQNWQVMHDFCRGFLDPRNAVDKGAAVFTEVPAIRHDFALLHVVVDASLYEILCIASLIPLFLHRSEILVFPCAVKQIMNYASEDRMGKRR